MIDGLVALNKPVGVTSLALVTKVRGLLGATKAGHAGTLDPAAEGVLPIALGTATRFLEILENADKAYLARVTFGVVTSTFDADGQVVEGPNPVRFELRDLLEALQLFTGDIEQTPPPYSAVKVGGRPAYKEARKGIMMPLPRRTVHVSHLVPLGWMPPHLYLWIQCSKGTYVRSLAHDLGQFMQCGAYLSYLLRVRHGPFYLDETVNLEELETAVRDRWIDRLILPPEDVLVSKPIAVVAHPDERAIAQGKLIRLETDTPAPELVALSATGRALAIIMQQGSYAWHPRKVFMRSP